MCMCITCQYSYLNLFASLDPFTKHQQRADQPATLRAGFGNLNRLKIEMVVV